MSRSLIESLIPYYPDIDDPNFESAIHKKEEFYELTMTAEGEVLQPGELLRQQKFLQRFMSPHTPYKECLVVHDPGTGKTCGASAVVEGFLAFHRDRRDVDPSVPPPNPALVLVGGADLVRSFRQEVAYRCTKGKYTQADLLPSDIIDPDSKKESVNMFNKNISRSYELETNITFLSKFKPGEDGHFDEITKNRVKAEYSNRVIIIDEAHHFRLGLDMYASLHAFLHTVENCRILLLTGTPIWDDVSEIASLMNLILPLDSQIETGKEFRKKYFTSGGDLQNGDQLREKMRGRISFLRSEMSSAERFEMGVKSPYTELTTVFPTMMDPVQAGVLQQKTNEVVKSKGAKAKEAKGGAVWSNARDVANCVFPEVNGVNLQGAKAFDKWVVKTTERQTDTGVKTVVSYSIKDNDTLVEAFGPSGLRKHSAKFSFVIDVAKNNADQVMYVYIENVQGCGAILLGLILELHGFEWVKSASQLNRPSTKRRFAVVTSNPFTTSKATEIQAILNIMNSRDNANGQKLQIIIGSEKISEGLNIKNVRQIIDVMPSFTKSEEVQAIARGLRYGSLDFLPVEERRVYIHRLCVVEGTLKKDDGFVISPENAFGLGKRLFAKIDKKITKVTVGERKNTIDTYVYNLAEAKEHKNSQIMRIVKEVAVDCAINYERNVLKTDTDGSRECDYQECNYDCVGVEPTSTENRVYSYRLGRDQLDYTTSKTHTVQTLKNGISNLMKKYTSLKIERMKVLLDVNDESIFLLFEAIDELISTMEVMRDKYGFRCYLKESNDIVYLDSSQFSSGGYVDSFYTNTPIITDESDLSTFIDALTFEEDMKEVKLCTSTKKLSYKSRVAIFEWIVSHPSLKRSTLETEVLKEFESRLYTLDGGVKVHLLLSEEFKGVAYDVGAKEMKVTGKMRKYDPKVDSAVFVTVVDKNEEKYFIEKIQGKGTKTLVSAGEEETTVNEEKIGAYKSIKDNKFRITRGTRGKVCTSFNVEELLDIIYDLDWLPTDDDDSFAEKSRKDLLTLIKGKQITTRFKKNLDDRSDDELRNILYLLTLKKPKLCDMLEEFFKGRGELAEF